VKYFRSWFLSPSGFDSSPQSHLFFFVVSRQFPENIPLSRKASVLGSNLLSICIRPPSFLRAAGSCAPLPGDPARAGMAPAMSGDARPPPQGTAPYALYQFGTSGAAVAVATAVTHPLGQLTALTRYYYWAGSDWQLASRMLI
jgi:hypothetical protein